MATVAGLTVVKISSHVLVFSIHFVLSVGMTVNTGKLFEIGCIVAFGAAYIIVFS